MNVTAEAGRPDARQMIEAAFDALQFLVVDSDPSGNVVGIALNGALNGALTSVRPARLNRMQGGEWGLLISVETNVMLERSLTPDIVTMLQSAGALLADCATAIGGDAQGRILLHRVIALPQLTVESLAAEIESTQNLRRLLDASPEHAGLPT
ncbi:hypothetical protein [Paraburkholderia bannensis]|uniref:hypothetical protein n=1 Tax=Paraburkholderia bannensis TaxID=765414 RepID=UPI002AAFA2BF|nr:hypothetical protein [Paraburkholderia bannensis]